jgi:methionyl-tRNA formyltransferase
MKVVLFALTGVGNNALKVLDSQDSVEVMAVFTNKEPEGDFPYYSCEHIHVLARRMKIKLYEGLSVKSTEAERIISDIAPDLIVVSSFNQIIPVNIIRLPRKGVINIHPSLLPAYRGATPTFWALAKGEQRSGVTAHFIEDEKVDCGRVICQDIVEITPSDTDGTLREKLAKLSEMTLHRALELVSSKEKKDFELQNESKASYFPKRGKEIVLDLDLNVVDILNLVRASSPYPKVVFEREGKRFAVVKALSLSPKEYKAGWVLKDKELIVRLSNGFVKLYTERVV